MSSSFPRIVVTSGALLLILFAAPLARAQPAPGATILSEYYPLNARSWAMAGAGAALSQPAEDPSANPAAAILAGKTEAIIGYLDTRLVAAFQVYQVSDLPSLPQGALPDPAPALSPASDHSLPACPPQAGFATRCGPDSPWAWGLSAQAATETWPRSLGLGVLYRACRAFSLGLNCNEIVAPGAALHMAALGAAYQSHDFTLAVDLCRTAGVVGEKKEMLLGAEYRFRNGLALRLGSADGNLTYGIGCRRGNWSLDLARLSMSRTAVLLPTSPFTAESNLTVVSMSCSY